MKMFEQKGEKKRKQSHVIKKKEINFKNGNINI